MQKKNTVRLKSQLDNRKNAFREETVLTNEKAGYIMKYILC